MEIANIDREILHIFWTTWGNSKKFSGKICFKIILKVTKKQGFTNRGGQIDPPAVLGLNYWKNNACSIPINEVICRKTPRRAKKSIHFQNKRTHNLETIEGIHKKNATLLETSLLKNYGKLSSLSPKNWGSLYQISSNWKAQICCHKRSISRPSW